MMKKFLVQIAGLFFVAIMIYACGNPVEEDEQEQEQIRQDSINQATIDTEIINDYILDNNLDQYDITVTETGLSYLTLDGGNGERYPAINDILTVDYIGSFVDGEIFDTSIKQIAEDNDIVNSSNPYTPIAYNHTHNGLGIGTTFVRGFSEGLQELVPTLSVDGVGLLIMPSALAYGPAGSASGTIPANSVIIFEIRLEGIRP